MNSFMTRLMQLFAKTEEGLSSVKERLWLRNSLYDSFRRLDILSGTVR